MSKKNILFLFLFFGLLLSNAFGTEGGNVDKLGLQGAWTKVEEWTKDGYLMKFIALIFFCIGVWRAFAGSILQFFFMLGFAVLVSQVGKITEAIGTAVF